MRAHGQGNERRRRPQRCVALQQMQHQSRDYYGGLFDLPEFWGE